MEGNEALRIWIFKALITERFRYTAYDSAFGSEIHTLIGSPSHSEVVKSEIKRFIIEALMVNPYISEISDFVFTQTKFIVHLLSIPYSPEFGGMHTGENRELSPSAYQIMFFSASSLSQSLKSG